MPAKIPEPWLSFLREVDSRLEHRISVHCLGAFPLMVNWGLPRATGDVDFIYIDPAGANSELLAIAGEDSDLATRFHLKFHRVDIAEYPQDYESRLIDLTPVGLKKIRLLALEVHDVVLAKLARNMPRDREDVRYLVSKGALNPAVLRQRFDDEVRPYAQIEERSAAVLDLWLDEFFGGSAAK
jgi:hypothetical protein